ncbi:hypothetical protein FIM62_02140, partial [Helicobacter pylori]
CGCVFLVFFCLLLFFMIFSFERLLFFVFFCCLCVWFVFSLFLFFFFFSSKRAHSVLPFVWWGRKCV